MIFVDSNVPMYLVGAGHPHKDAAVRAIESAATRRERLVTSAEVLQEILHRYHAVRRPEQIQPCLRALLGIVDEIFAIDQQDVLRARDILLGGLGLSSRDALHVAVMERQGIKRVLSFDRGFDRVHTIERIG